jgi:hypothetical protein
MDRTQDIENFEDKILRDLLKENHIKVKTSSDFTKKTMDLIMQEWLENPIEETSKKHGYKYWIILIAIISISAAIYLATDTRKLINMSEISWLRTIDKNYLVYLHSLYSYVIKSFLNISPIVYIVISALFSIYVADRFLKRAQTIFHNFFFI